MPTEVRQREPDRLAADVASLTNPVTRSALRDFARALKSSRQLAVNPSEVARSIGLLIVFALLWVFCAATLVALAAIAFVLAYNPTTHLVVVPWFFAVPVPLALLWVLSEFMYGILRRDVRILRPLRKWYMLRRLADANGWAYAPRVAAPGYSGCIFLFGENRRVTDQIRIRHEPWVEIANYRYASRRTTELGRNEWGYIAIQLDHPMPHMVLEARANRRPFRNRLPASFRRVQALSLEGDFDRHFTLFAPREYERDALYVFTPDLMALLIDEASLFDVEIVDDRMYIYSEKTFDMLAPGTYALVDRLVSMVGEKARSQAARYVDERPALAARDQIAPEGRRLEQRSSAAVLIVATIVLIAFVMPLIRL